MLDVLGFWRCGRRLCDMVVAEAGEAEGVWQTEVAVAKVVVAVMSVAVKAAPVAAVAAVRGGGVVTVMRA